MKGVCMRPGHRARLICLAACMLLLGVCARAAQPEVETDWLTGPRLREQLATPVTVSWSNIPLGTALRRLAATQHVAILLDRRIDSDRGIDIALTRVPLAEGLGQVAERLNLAYSQLGPIAYLGPPEFARPLRSVAALRTDDAKRLPREKSRKFLATKALAWQDLAEPRAIIEALAAEVGAKLNGGERIPHDLWNAAALPPATWVDRMTLLTAQFGLSFRIDDAGQQITLVDWPRQVVLRRGYPLGKDGARQVERWKEALPDATVRIEKNKIMVEGLIEDHEAIEQRLRGAAPPGTPKPTRTTTKPGKDVYQLSIENTALDKVVKQLGERLGLEIRWQPGAKSEQEPATDQLITVRVHDVDLDTLWQAVFKGTGWTFRRSERTLTIVPAEREGADTEREGAQ